MRLGGWFGVACAVHAIGFSVSSASSQALDRSRRPIVPPDAPVLFPKTFSRTLANGIRVVVVEDHALPLVAVRTVSGVDSLDDPAGKEGLFALTTAMLAEGTTSMSLDKQSAAIAALGYHELRPSGFTTISQNFQPSLALVADMLMHPAFPEPALQRQKAALVDAVHVRMQARGTAVRRLYLRQLFGQRGRLVRTMLPTDSSVSSLTREDVESYYATFFGPSTTTIIIVGDVGHTTAFADVATAFMGWRAARQPARMVAVADPGSAEARTPTTIYLLDRPTATQSEVYVGTTGPARTSRDFPALEVLARVLGATSASRIQKNLRERHAYTYSGTPGDVTWQRAPDFSVIGGSVAMNVANVDSALVEWVGELRRMREQPPTVQEMELARGSLRGALVTRLETIDGVARVLALLVQNGLPTDFYATYLGRIDRVTAHDVLAAAVTYIDPQHLTIVVVGDRKRLEPALSAAGIAPIVVVDELGNPVG